MKKTSTQTEYLSPNGWRYQIDVHEKGTDITIFDEENTLILTEPIERVKIMSSNLNELLKTLGEE